MLSRTISSSESRGHQALETLEVALSAVRTQGGKVIDPYERSMSSQIKLAHEVARELTRAQSLFPAINTPHEGLAVVWEEFEEFKLEVFALNVAKGRDTREAMRKELIQLAAMALRTIHDCALPASPTSPTEKKE